MQQAIFAILTSKEVREAIPIEAILDKEFTIGARWL